MSKKVSDAKPVRGFTLIELMVTLAVGAILLMVAAPSFVTFKRNSELTSATNSMVGALSMARGEALKRGKNVVLIPASGGDWSTGAIVFVDANSDQLLDPTETVVNRQDALPSYISATGKGTALGSGAYIMFDASGYTKTSSATYQAATLKIARSDLSDSAQTEQTRIIIVAKTGRIRACKPASDNTCTESATE